MKPLLIIILSMLVANTCSAECIKVEYVELQDYKDEDLAKKYCRDKVSLEFANVMVNSARTMAKLQSDTNRLADAGKSYEELDSHLKVANVCQAEQERVLRLLEKRQIQTATLCQKPKQ